jgi:hypothetical protein
MWIGLRSSPARPVIEPRLGESGLRLTQASNSGDQP